MTAAPPTTLADWLLARIAEDEARQRPGPWTNVDSWHDLDCRWTDGGPKEATACNCGVPARVLAECEAKRRIIEEWQRWDAMAGAYPDSIVGTAEGLETAVRLLALPYADRDGFRDEWRP